DDWGYGTKVIPLNMTREELREGYLQLMRDVYEPNAFFEGLEELYLQDKLHSGQARDAYWRKHWWTGLKGLVWHIGASLFLYWRICYCTPHPPLRAQYRL